MKKPCPKAALVPYDEGDDSVVCDGKSYEVEMGDDGTFLLQASAAEKDDMFLRVEDDWLEDDLIYTKRGKDYVRRNDQDYHVRADENDNLQVVGKNIDGMVQLKVEDIFQRAAGAKVDLDLLEPSAAREEFYSRIDMPSFVQAFIATVLLRPQDGKVVNLGESNVLFQALPGRDNVADPLNPECKLRPIIIDLDETMPAENDYLRDHDQKTEIHVVRNGLMGFPQARQLLAGEDKQMAEESLREIVAKKAEAESFLKRFVGKGTSAAFKQDHVLAYSEIVDKIQAFLALHERGGLDWSLQQLFFAIFPEYEEQWNALGKLTPERKAQFIGKNTLSDALALSRRYVK